MNINNTIYIAGHRGMVGSALHRHLTQAGYHSIMTKTRQQLDLTDTLAVKDFFEQERPEYVFLAAAKVGGILANRDYPADFIYQNLQIQNNIIHQAYRTGVKKLLFLGSSCIYPKHTPQPIHEHHLLTGSLEPTNEPYAIAKIAGIKLCQNYNRQYYTNFIACMPTNLYGPNDNFDLKTSHVFAALIAKFHNAKISGKPNVTLRGDGSAMREFLHVDDLASACVYLMKTFTPTSQENIDGDIFLNIGTGTDVTIKELAESIQTVVGFTGSIKRDTTKPNGTPRKLLDSTKIHTLGRHHTIGLLDGIKSTYKRYLHNHKHS